MSIRWQLAEPVVRATLYEGYVLYPYRPSALKNRQRFFFGGLAASCCAFGRVGFFLKGLGITLRFENDLADGVGH